MSKLFEAFVSTDEPCAPLNVFKMTDDELMEVGEDDGNLPWVHAAALRLGVKDVTELAILQTEDEVFREVEQLLRNGMLHEEPIDEDMLGYCQLTMGKLYGYDCFSIGDHGFGAWVVRKSDIS